MSFFKKLTQEFEDLKASLSDKDKDKEKDKQDEEEKKHDGEVQAQRGDQYHQPEQQYASPPLSNQGPPGMPPLPAGWVAQFDHASQRWYYVEQATGHTQWEPPIIPGAVYSSPPAPPASYGSYAPSGQPSPYDNSYRGYGAAPGPQYGGDAAGYYPGSGYAQHDQNYAHEQSGGPYGGHDAVGEQKSGSNKSGMLLGAAGGLAVGAVGGALVADALDDSGDEHPAAPAVPPGTYAPVAPADPAVVGDPSMPPPVLPPTDAEGDSVSSSDRESVQEAREDYEEALAEAADSDASSSEQEELEEAREEYVEEYEENYE